MTAVGLKDVFEYGGKFLGYLGVVAIGGGVLVGGGAYLASRGGVSLGDPSVSALSTSQAIGGALLVAVGGLFALAGVFGLSYKFVADVIAVGVATASEPGAASVATAATAEGATGDEADADHAVETDDGEADVHADDERVTDEVETERAAPSTGEDGPSEPGSEPPAPPTNSSDPAFDRTQPPETRDGRSHSPMMEAEAAGSAAASEPEPVSAGDDSPVEASEPDAHEYSPAGDGSADEVGEPVDEDDWSQSEYATGTMPDDSDDAGDEGDVSDEGNETGAATDEDQSEPTEWTPPDPSEFEQPAAEPGDDAGSETEGWTADGEASWSESADEGGPDERRWANAEPDPDDPATGVDEVRSQSATDPFEADADRSDDGFDAEPSPDDDAAGADDVAFADEAEGAEELDDDVTLADEGVTSFDADGDDDPLADRLPGDGS